ncbi:MAG: glycoside hydrolase family 3 C-terminal domain-containing protein [Mediterranea sp.]|jgi:beta-glucosidase|nr:glycoside hydrolase family 3 C-terminal domain-containing protein [Mediterranea sp.]
MNRKYLPLFLFAIFAVATPVKSQTRTQPSAPLPAQAFRDTTLSDDARINHLMSLLTLDEKIDLLSTDLGIPRLGIPHCGHFEGLHGLALGGPGGWGGRERTADGRMITHEYPTTIFPQAYGLGCSWDRDLLKRIAEQSSHEARLFSNAPGSPQKALVMRAPNADLARDPRWGRTEESFGEDPYLVSELVIASIKGLQGDHPRYWRTAALMKHFLANSNEDGRDSTSSDFDRQLFDEYYAYPFRRGIQEGGSRAFMAAYNSWNGIPMTIHPCLEEITRREWGNNGIICTDGGALKLLVNAHHSFPTLTEGAAAVVKAGVGQFLDEYKPYIQEALEKKLLSEADINRAIRGNLYVALKLGLLDENLYANPYYTELVTSAMPEYANPEVHKLVREATARTVVLLKNDRATLPLDTDKIKKIAVIGPYADKVVQDWYSGTPKYTVTILDGIRKAVGNNVEVLYAEDNRMDRAAKIAAEADVALVCVGNHPYGVRRDWKFSPVPSDGREAVDRTSLQLPDEDLVRQIHAVNPNTVLVLVSSFPYAINWSDRHLPAILHITHCSQEQGNGLADVLFGKVNPAGRTTQTWVRDITDLPPIMDYDIRNGRTYMYFRGTPLYPFGYGLSYTTFRYDRFETVQDDGKHLRVNVYVTNVGSRDGDEVVQLYATDADGVSRLCAFDRVFIRAGETKKVELTAARDRIGKDAKLWAGGHS